MTTTVDADEELRMLASSSSGIHDTNNAKNPFANWWHVTNNAKNPFANWWHVYIPYCTGDVHAGNQTKDYGITTIHHRGAVNAQTAMKWAWANLPKNPDTVATVGCSAGSMGSFVNAPYVNHQFPNAKKVHWADSYLGVTTANQFTQAYQNWDMQFAPFIPGLDKKSLFPFKFPDTMVQIISASFSFFPGATTSVYTSNADIVQESYFTLGGGNILNWTNLARAEIAAVEKSAVGKQFTSYVASGGDHCRSQDDGFYSVSQNGVKLYEWVTNIAQGTVPNSVDCKPHCGL